MPSLTPDPAKLETLRNHPNAASGYITWIERFIIPLLQRVGLKTIVRKTPGKYTITIKLPNA